MRCATPVLLLTILAGTSNAASPPKDPTSVEIRVKVLASVGSCQIEKLIIPCSKMVNYLSDTRKTSKSQPVVLDDQKIGRKDTTVKDLLAQLRAAGFQKSMAIGFITAPP